MAHRLMGGIVVGLLAWLACTTCAAQLALSPPLVYQTVRPGATAEFAIGITSRSEATLACSAELHDLGVSPEGMPTLASEKVGRGCSGWITPSPTAFQLKPGEGQSIRCRLRAPRDAVGGYYAALTVTATPLGGTARAPGKGEAAIHLSYSLLSAILVTVPGPRMRVDIQPGTPEVALEYETGGAWKGWRARLSVENRGNMHERMRGDVRIMNNARQLVASAALISGQGFMLPGYPREFTARGQERLRDGAYVIVAKLRGARVPVTATSTGAFSVVEGQATSGEPTPEIAAYLASLRPTVAVEPGNIRVSLAPGGPTSQVVTVRNLADEDIDVAVRVRTWVLGASGDIELTRAQAAHARSAVSWLKVEPETFLLRPRQSRGVRVWVAAPRGANGEHYAGLTFFVEDEASSVAGEAALMRSVLITASVKGTDHADLQIQDLSVQHPGTADAIYSVTIANVGNVMLDVSCLLHLLTPDGRELARVRSEGTRPLMPSCITTTDIAWPRALATGDYRLRATAMAEGADAVTVDIPLTIG